MWHLSKRNRTRVNQITSCFSSSLFLLFTFYFSKNRGKNVYCYPLISCSTEQQRLNPDCGQNHHSLFFLPIVNFSPFSFLETRMCNLCPSSPLSPKQFALKYWILSFEIIAIGGGSEVILPPSIWAAKKTRTTFNEMLLFPLCLLSPQNTKPMCLLFPLCAFFQWE